MSYENIQNYRQQLQELIKQAEDKITYESDNFNALAQQFQDLLAKLDEQTAITNKYGNFLAEMYRDIAAFGRDNEKNMELQHEEIVYETIAWLNGNEEAAMENRRQLVESGIEEKEQRLKELQVEIKRQEGVLANLQRAIEQAAAQCAANPPAAAPPPEKPQQPARGIKTVINEAPEIKKKPLAQFHPAEPAPEPKPVPAPAPAPAPEPKPAPAPAPESCGIAVRRQGEWTVPAAPESGHIYLCADTGMPPLDITVRFPDIRMNHLRRFGQKFARTGKPQFRLSRENGSFFIEEQQNMVNHINGRLLSGKHKVSSGDVITITDLDKMQHSLLFIIG